MDNYEKNVNKVANTVEKVAGVANRLYIGCIMIVANLFFMGFCLWGVYAGYISWKLEQNGATTIGEVVRLDESDSTEGGCCVYTPVIEFVANDRIYSFEGDTASNPPVYQVGDEVSVLYDPADPDTAQINKWSERWLLPVIMIPAMIVTALIVNFFMWRAFRRNDMVIDE